MDENDKIEQYNTISLIRRWITDIVVELNLCPFAKREMVSDRIRYVVEPSSQQLNVLETLLREFGRLDSDNRYETTIIILKTALPDFGQYNDFLSLVDELIVQSGYEGIFQVASFHPDYQYASTDMDEVSNYTNRSPLPLLHILREESVSRAISAYPDADSIPDRNIALLESLGIDSVLQRYERVVMAEADSNN